MERAFNVNGNELHVKLPECARLAFVGVPANDIPTAPDGAVLRNGFGTYFFPTLRLIWGVMYANNPYYDFGHEFVIRLQKVFANAVYYDWEVGKYKVVNLTK